MAVLKNRCMKGSFAASVMAYIEARKWNRYVLESYTDAFICPSHFMASKMRKDSFDASKIHVVCNHIDPEKLKILDSTGGERDNYYTYIGRLSSEKGVETLITAASKLPYTLKVAGDGPLMHQLKEQYAEHENIEFLGHQNARQVATLLSRAKFSVLPSEWYENNPLSVIESLCAGTPVVGARIGGIPELLNDSNGLTFASGNRNELADAIKTAFDKQWNNSSIKNMAINQFSTQEYLSLIEEIYQ